MAGGRRLGGAGRAHARAGESPRDGAAEDERRACAQDQARSNFDGIVRRSWRVLAAVQSGPAFSPCEGARASFMPRSSHAQPIWACTVDRLCSSAGL